mgnify:CR=1 FL=1
MAESKIVQFIPGDDKAGLLKNVSELLQEVRDGNVDSLAIGYSRKDESMRVFWFGDTKRMAEFFLLTSQIKYDYLSNRFKNVISEDFEEEDGD